MKTAIITGVSGQDGAYLAQFLINKNYKVVGLTRNNHANKIFNLQYLNISDKLILEECDLLDIVSIINILKKHQPNEVYNLAAQSSVGLSFKQPISTINFNVNSVLNILEAIRTTDVSTRFYQACSSEMFGKVNRLPVTLETPMYPLSPYAVSKATAYLTVRNYREAYSLYACSGILFNHDSYLRDPSFFIKKIIVQAFELKKDPEKKMKVGNVDVKRDFGYSPKYIEAMWSMLQIKQPKDFIICSGKSVSLKDVVHYVFKKFDLNYDRMIVDPDLYRPTDIQDIYGDNSDAKKNLNWDYEVDFFQVLDLLILEEEQNQKQN